MTGQSKPDYSRSVDMLTRSAIKEMIIPPMLPVLSPIILFIVVSIVADQNAAVSAVGAMLLGVIVTGLCNFNDSRWRRIQCKNMLRMVLEEKDLKLIKLVTGDTVGDPYKDTADLQLIR